MSDLQNKVVKISSIEPGEGKRPIKVKVTPPEKGVSYIVWKTKQDGEDSAAFQVLSKISLTKDLNQTEYEIAYAEEKREFVNEKKENISYTQRTIRAIKPKIVTEGI